MVSFYNIKYRTIKYNVGKNNKGFTFVELSIVMLIIGFLIAAVLAGQSLIDSARIRAVIEEVNNYQSATDLFEQRFGGIPGDLSDAQTQITNCNAGNICFNGDGDGQIEWASGSPNGEGVQAWRQMAIAGFISGVFSGVTDGMNTAIINPEANRNIPPAKITPLGYGIDYVATISGVNVGNHLLLGTTDGNGINNAAALIPDQARQIDEKMDDGLPNTGRTLDILGTAMGNTCQTGGQYDLSITTTVCTLSISID